MRQREFSLHLALAAATVASAVLIFVLFAWIRSYTYSETFIHIGNGKCFALDTYGGEFSLWRCNTVVTAPPYWMNEHYTWRTAITSIQLPIINPAGEDMWFAGFGYASNRRMPIVKLPRAKFSGIRGIVVPFWSVGLVTAILCGFTWRRVRRIVRNRSIGLCSHCGYDLRASTERCPECGTAIRQP